MACLCYHNHADKVHLQDLPAAQAIFGESARLEQEEVAANAACSPDFRDGLQERGPMHGHARVIDQPK